MQNVTADHPTQAQTNRRGRRTRIALRNALADEIRATGDLTQVTVTAVTERADVTRRTFYSHYRDIPDLVRCIEDETLAELEPLIMGVAKTTLDELEVALDRFEPCPGTMEALAYFVERGSYLAPLLGDGGDPAFSKRFEAMVHELAHDRVAQGFVVPDAAWILDYYLAFVISAEVGVLIRWLTNGMQEPTAIIARMMTALLFVRPGDLYGRSIGFDIPTLAPKVLSRRKELLNGSHS